jgi:hypothetical protein
VFFEPSAQFRLTPSPALAMGKDVDYLLIAKPVATNHLRIRHDCAVFSQYSWLLVVLFEGRNFCQIVTESNVSEICEIGEQGGLVVGFRSLVCIACGTFFEVMTELLTI